MKSALPCLAMMLAACASVGPEADPGPYLSYECEELDALAESFRADYTAQLFADSDLSEFERQIESGAAQRIGDTTSVKRPFEARQAAERRAIAAARRQKQCS